MRLRHPRQPYDIASATAASPIYVLIDGISQPLYTIATCRGPTSAKHLSQNAQDNKTLVWLTALQSTNFNSLPPLFLDSNFHWSLSPMAPFAKYYQRAKNVIHAIQALIVFVAWAITIAILTKGGKLDGRIWYYFTLVSRC